MKFILKLFAIVFFHFISIYIYSLETIELDDSNGIYPILNNFEYLEDKDKKLTIEDINGNDFQHKFKENDNKSSNFGYTDSNYWVRFKIKNNSTIQKEWLLKINYNWFYNVEFYTPVNDGKFVKKEGSHIGPVSTRDIKNRKIVFTILLDEGHENTYYMKLFSRSSMHIDIQIYSYNRFLKEDHESQIIYGILYGIIFIMIFYNLLLFFVIHDRSYLYYSIYTAFFVIQQTILNQQFYEYLPSFLDWTRNSAYINSLGLMVIFAFLFSSSFLSTKKNNPAIHKTIQIQIVLILMMLIGRFFIPYFIIRTCSDILIFSSSITVLIAGIANIFKGNKTARFYLLSWSLFLVSNIVLQILQGIFKYIPIYYDILLISGVVNVTLLSIALADRYRLIRLEKESVERNNMEQTEFFINLSHEIKTPLTLISNYLDKYLKNNELSNELKIIKKNIDKLLQDMINFFDVLKFQKGSQVYAHDKIINFSDFLNTKADLFKSISSNYQITLSYDLEKDIFVKIDPSALERIVNNIVENAIKYNKPDGQIDIALRSDDGKAEFEVSDTGIGINEDQFENIFMPYYQISHKKSNIQGIGMGLSIVKNILDKISAVIEVKSVPGEGSVFKIIFNKYVLQKNDAVYDEMSFLYPTIAMPVIKQAINNKFNDDGKYNILIVEDNKDLLSLLQERINENYNVFVSINGKEALEKLDRFPVPDVIISDIMMDDMNGYDFFDQISQKDGYREIPFIFITAKSAIDEKIKALKKGAIDFIFKPFVIDELISKIESIIRYKELKKENFERDKFASIGMLIGGVSHEIFNPLSGISGPLENLKKMMNNLDPENPKAGKYFSHIEKSLLRIENIINNLKSLYQNKEIKKENINLIAVVDAVLFDYRKNNDKNIVFSEDIGNDMSIIGDKDALFQILSNLIANAVDVSGDNDEIKIVANKSHDMNVIKVIDKGKGIGRENIDKIFNAFYSTKNVGAGTGLGLYIVKDLIIKMGWKINVESAEGVGTTFIITAG